MADGANQIDNFSFPSDEVLKLAADAAKQFLMDDTQSYNCKGELENFPHGFPKPFHAKSEKDVMPNIQMLSIKSIIAYGQGLQHYVAVLAGEDVFDFDLAELEKVCAHVFDDMVTHFNLALMDNGMTSKEVTLAELTRPVTGGYGRYRWNNRFAQREMIALQKLGLWNVSQTGPNSPYSVGPGPILVAFYEDVYEPIMRDQLDQMGGIG